MHVCTEDRLQKIKKKKEVFFASIRKTIENRFKITEYGKLEKAKGR